MDDRAVEVISTIAWAKQNLLIDSNRIGILGASQAGWLLPKVACKYPELCFMIAVSPAINWLSQG